MNIAKVKVSNNIAEVSDCRTITSGTVGAVVEFEFDSTWDGYTKTYVWKAGGLTKDDTAASGVVPAEVLARPRLPLQVGVYGVKGEKVTPTIWANLGEIRPGADPSGDETTDPALPVWAQVQENIDRLEEASAAAQTAAEGAQALAARLRDYDTIDVKQMGARGDGVTDDSAVIQAALDTYGTVVLPEGVYRVKGLTITKSNTKIIGENATLKISDVCKITERAIEGIGLYIHSDDPDDPVRNVEVCGIHFDGNVQHFYDCGKDVTQDDFDSDGIRCYNAENVHVHHCSFDNVGDRGIGSTVVDYDKDAKAKHFGVHGLHVHECEFFKGDLPHQDVTFTADSPKGTDGYKPTPGTYRIYPTVNAIQLLQTGGDARDSDIVVERCTVYKSPNYGFMFYPVKERIVVRDCTIMNCGLHTSEDKDINDGDGVIDYGYYTGNYTKADHCDGGGIKLNNVRDALVEHCYIYGVRGSNISVHNATTAFYPPELLAKWGPAKNVVIRDNDIIGNPDQLRTGNGILVEGGADVRIIGNTIRNQVGAKRTHAVHSSVSYQTTKAISANVPVYLEGNTIESDTAVNNVHAGIELYSGQVVNNIITDVKIPIYAKTVGNKVAEDLIISGNKITQTNADLKTVKGVDIQIVTNAIVSGNIFTGVARGVQVYTSSKNVTICGNLFKECSRPIISSITDDKLAEGGVSGAHDNLNIYGNTFTKGGVVQVNYVVFFENTKTSAGPNGTFKPTNSKVDFVPVFVPVPEPEPEPEPEP